MRKLTPVKMANTYKKVYLHIVFAVKNRDALLHKSWRSNLFSYISGLLNKRGHYSLAVNGHIDHIHILFDYNLNELIPDLVREIKKASTKYIKENKLTQFRFEWQTGYGVFSVDCHNKSKMINYIINQEIHHKNNNFKDEYLKLLKNYNIDFNDQYLFDFIN